jgi:glucosamine-6-phosphate deaminase
MEGFLPAGWDLERIDKVGDIAGDNLVKRNKWWNPKFEPFPCGTLADFDTYMGHEIAREILLSRQAGKPLILILPVGPMGMYRWTVFFLKEWGVSCEHVHGFNMDEWADAQGNSMPGDQPGGFEHAMTQALFAPLGKLSVPKEQRNFATKRNLPTYAKKISDLKSQRARLVTVYGIGRVCHIAFWEPHLAAEFPTLADWKRQTHKIGVALQPLTIEQNAITSFNSRFTLVPCFANSIGPGLFLQSDFCIGGADGAYPQQGNQWQGMSICSTLQYGPDPWVPSSFMPTMPGRLFFLKELLGPLTPDAH